ncbi:twin-arginine translocase TatA/TatE family subunit [Oceanicaulis sp. MMSF_3324]|uniref:twin-arginine translocase TatA/TatE family subunit n=1 Tax=Oceanicaulis sp. MMSF_3324 TaxID=3046702 RepID=UPI00273E6F66|nr:twin-arginine translocase TatA/TatE family subunit [Oceanicaulis sp. MMSF_3324]
MGAHWTGILVVIVLLVLLFGGRGKISGLMGDLAKGVTEFRKGLRDTSEDEKSTTSQSTAALNEGASQDSSSAREDERTGG